MILLIWHSLFTGRVDGMPWNVTQPNVSQGESNPLSGCVHSINFNPLALVVAIVGLVHSEVSIRELQVNRVPLPNHQVRGDPCAMSDGTHMFVTLGMQVNGSGIVDLT